MKLEKLLNHGEVLTKMADYEFTLPCYIKSGKKNIAINLNWYRNAHHRLSNNIKIKFKGLIADQVQGLDPISCKVSIKFVYYASRNNSPDLDNFTSVSKKFFQDALVDLGFLPDDNINYIVKTIEEYGGICRDNPRVMAYVREIENN